MTDGMALYRSAAARAQPDGLRGRIGIFQLMTMNEELETLAAQKARAGHRAAAWRTACGRCGRRARESRGGLTSVEGSRASRPTVARLRAVPRPRAGQTRRNVRRCVQDVVQWLVEPRVVDALTAYRTGFGRWRIVSRGGGGARRRSRSGASCRAGSPPGNGSPRLRPCFRDR
jgi:hypothetical protein